VWARHQGASVFCVPAFSSDWLTSFQPGSYCDVDVNMVIRKSHLKLILYSLPRYQTGPQKAATCLDTWRQVGAQ